MSEARQATRGSAIKLSAELAGRALSIATSLLIARGLAPAEFGAFAFLSGVALLASELGELGLQATAQRALVARTLALRAMLVAKAWLLLPLAAALAAGWALLPEAALAELRPGVLLPLVVFFLLAGWGEFLGVALRARGRRAGEAAVIVCARASALSLVVPALERGLGLPGVAWALAASALPALLLAAALLRRWPEPAAGAAAAPPVPAILRQALPLGVNGGLALLSLRVEIFVLPLFAAAHAVGVFAAALKIVDTLILVPAAIAAGAMPALTREALLAAGPVRARTATSVALLAVPAAVGLGWLAPEVVVLVYGEAYAEAALPLRLLAPALVPLFANTVLLHALLARGRSPLLPRLTALRVAVAALLAAALIPPLGAAGAACGFALAEAALVPLAARACAREGFAVPVLRPLALASALSLPMALVLGLLAGGAGARIAAGALSYGATLLLAWRARPRLFAAPLGEPVGA